MDNVSVNRVLVGGNVTNVKLTIGEIRMWNVIVSLRRHNLFEKIQIFTFFVFSSL
jgi:hypothetical protein